MSLMCAVGGPSVYYPHQAASTHVRQRLALSICYNRWGRGAEPPWSPRGGAGATASSPLQSRLVGPPGVEPGSPKSRFGVLPLDDGPPLDRAERSWLVTLVRSAHFPYSNASSSCISVLASVTSSSRGYTKASVA